MWRDPMDELIADLEGTVEAEPSRFNDQMPSFLDMQIWTQRFLRAMDAAEMAGTDLAEVDPTYDEEFAAFQARWPKWYGQDTSEGKK